MSKLSNQTESKNIHYKDPLAIKTTSDIIITSLPKENVSVIVLCIGTDRSTGDSLGPLTGTLLKQMKPSNINVYGTLHKPVHAVNLEEAIKNIKQTYKQPFIVAVDASLGKSASIGNLFSGLGPIKPGAALNKELPAVGNAYVTGVVNISGYMDYAVLQSTRLSIVHDMSQKIALSFKKVDLWMEYYKINQYKSILNKSNQTI